MDDKISEVLEPQLAKLHSKDLAKIVLIMAGLIITLAGVLIKLKVDSDVETREGVNELKALVKTIPAKVDSNYTILNNKIDAMQEEQKLEHKGIDEKFDILKASQVRSSQKQMELIDHVLKNARPEGFISPQKQNDLLMIKNNTQYIITYSNEINSALKSESTTPVKKKISDKEDI